MVVTSLTLRIVFTLLTKTHPESLLRTEYLEDLDITAPICHTNRDCGTGCCYHGLCLAYCPNDMAKRGDGGATWGELSLFFGLLGELYLMYRLIMILLE